MGPAVFFLPAVQHFGRKMFISAYINQNVSVQQKVDRNRPKMRGTDQVSRRFHYKSSLVD